MIEFYGHGLSEGIGCGIIKQQTTSLVHKRVQTSNCEYEVERFTHACDLTGQKMQKLAIYAKNQIGLTAASLITAHQLMVTDTHFIESVKEYIIEQKTSAEYAVQEVIKKQIESLKASKDAYLIGRTHDFIEIANHIYEQLSEKSKKESDSLKKESVILICDEIFLTDILMAKEHGIAGIMSEESYEFTHAAVFAQMTELPMIECVPSEIKKFEGNMAKIDANKGIISINCKKT